MINITKTDVWGFEAAIRGMRNPKNSWVNSDSHKCSDGCPLERVGITECECEQTNFGYCIEQADFALAMKLRNAGTDHGKFLRMIHVQMDINAPLYWWKEYDTYKVGTVADSCSTMHKIHTKPFVIEDFSTDHLSTESKLQLALQIDYLNYCRDRFNVTEDKSWWWQLIQMLPTSYNQLRTCDVNYEVLRNMYKSRKDHKLDEWHTFCEWAASLPYSELITGVN